MHRQLQPATVRIVADGRLEIVEPRASAGTEFAAPEQDPNESRSDLYSVGVLLVWMLTGRSRPADRELQRYPPRVSAFLSMAVCPVARRRFATAAAMRRAVLELLLKYGRLRCERE